MQHWYVPWYLKKIKHLPLFIKRWQIINNYSPVSLLPIHRKIFERIIFNSLYEHHEVSKLLSAHQSGFRYNDSCVNRLLSIIHYLCKAFNDFGVFKYVWGFWQSMAPRTNIQPLQLRCLPRKGNANTKKAFLNLCWHNGNLCWLKK